VGFSGRARDLKSRWQPAVQTCGERGKDSAPCGDCFLRPTVLKSFHGLVHPLYIAGALQDGFGREVFVLRTGIVSQRLEVSQRHQFELRTNIIIHPPGDGPLQHGARTEVAGPASDEDQRAG